ncbi:MAG: hypothetical protein KIS67_11260 [Verrucomicrobiae bacterium]|nr:hypothetical protein [Verrucomicrobiae bacterium]
MELTVEIAFDGWDGWLFRDRLNNGKGLPSRNNPPPSIFTTNHPVRCVVGTNEWLLEFTSENALTTYWFTGTNIIEHTEITKELPNRPRVGERFTEWHPSNDGNPGRPVRVADIMGAGSFSWLAFCSGPFLQREDRQIYPPGPFWKYSNLIYSGWTDRTTVFNDGLGLPRSLDLIATNNQPIFQYQVHRSTNVLGWSFPLEFYCVQYLPTGTNLWKLDFTAKGRVTAIGPGSKPEIPEELLKAGEK